MKFQSTRGKAPLVSGLQALMNGLAPDGGLYVPAVFPKLDFDWEKLKDASYVAIGRQVLSLFFDEFSEAEITNFLTEAYENFDYPQKVKIQELDSRKDLLELFHGPTLAFKDMALSLLPYLLTAAIQKTQHKETLVILTATSGDTGGAALNGFNNVTQTKIVVYYPSVGVSKLQRQQMTTASGKNTHVVAVTGNFDDAQKAVKQLLIDQELIQRMQARSLRFSSANSINIGRLAAQVVYYVYAYAQLVQKGRLKAGQTLDVTVPTGNFGDILAAYWAKKMGLPLGKLTVASNANHVLTDFFASGIYQADRDFKVTSSPAMDILVSSNLERLLFDLAGADSVAGWMKDLAEKQTYEIDDKTLAKLQKQFNAAFCDSAQTSQTIKKIFTENNYLLDPHTAVAVAVNENFPSPDQQLIVSTASPFKFAETVLTALGQTAAADPELNLNKLSQFSKQAVPAAIADLFTKKPVHTQKLAIKDLRADLIETLGL
ncbi:threonine synthase [Oenococcus sicerae]|uniref:Threonine synthase n=1 Tax=Oenococcus sicerae TaxID=2203724 RepID=A0AAJ1R9D9_9LACO|nr:threonine synthase [Oenococcus sicerae]MDN6900614.1 threonine synthase [Oenococcus sicerae]